MQITAIILLFFFMGWLFFWHKQNKKNVLTVFPDSFRKILKEKVVFYKSLNDSGRSRFEERMLQFLADVKITGVRTAVEEEDTVFIAASAIIPIFAFENWQYTNLHEVLLYPGSFNEAFAMEGSERPVLGMVGNGALQQVMILSQQSLRQGFANTTDTSNTGIHEFVHLVDKTDGAVDGIPENLLSKQYLLPWITRMHEELQEITKGESDINPYGATSHAEFLAVASEYFFERPDLLQSKHPELYNLLQKIFRQDPNAMRNGGENGEWGMDNDE